MGKTEEIKITVKAETESFDNGLTKIQDGAQTTATVIETELNPALNSYNRIIDSDLSKDYNKMYGWTDQYAIKINKMAEEIDKHKWDQTVSGMEAAMSATTTVLDGVTIGAKMTGSAVAESFTGIAGAIVGFLGPLGDAAIKANDWGEKARENLTRTKDLVISSSELSDTIANSAINYETYIGALRNQSIETDTVIAGLTALEEKHQTNGSLTEEETVQLNEYIKSFNALHPTIGLAIDDTGNLMNMTAAQAGALAEVSISNEAANASTARLNEVQEQQTAVESILSKIGAEEAANNEIIAQNKSKVSDIRLREIAAMEGEAQAAAIANEGLSERDKIMVESYTKQNTLNTALGKATTLQYDLEKAMSDSSTTQEDLNAIMAAAEVPAYDLNTVLWEQDMALGELDEKAEAAAMSNEYLTEVSGQLKELQPGLTESAIEAGEQQRSLGDTYQEVATKAEELLGTEQSVMEGRKTNLNEGYTELNTMAQSNTDNLNQTVSSGLSPDNAQTTGYNYFAALGTGAGEAIPGLAGDAQNAVNTASGTVEKAIESADFNGKGNGIIQSMASGAFANSILAEVLGAKIQLASMRVSNTILTENFILKGKTILDELASGVLENVALGNALNSKITQISDSLPKIKIRVDSNIPLPHFAMSGSFNIKMGSVPNVYISGWYDKGGYFNSPQLIGIAERRPEFVGAAEDLEAFIAKSVNNAFVRIDPALLHDIGSIGGGTSYAGDTVDFHPQVTINTQKLTDAEMKRATNYVSREFAKIVTGRKVGRLQ